MGTRAHTKGKSYYTFLTMRMKEDEDVVGVVGVLLNEQ